MTNIITIATITIQENLRNKILYLLLFMSVILVGGTVFLNTFNIDGTTRLIKDLSITLISFFSIVLSLVLSVTALRNEIDRKTLYPILTKPVARIEFIWGKFAGIFLLMLFNILIMAVELFILTYLSSKNLSWNVFYTLFFVGIECGIITAFAIWFSIFMTPPVTAAVVVLLYVLGQSSSIYLSTLEATYGSWASFLLIAKGFLPSFEFFHLKTAFVHNYMIATRYLIYVTIYGILFIVFALSGAELSFEKKDL